MPLIEIIRKKHATDAEGDEACGLLADAGLPARSVRVHQLYYIEGSMDKTGLRRLAQELLTDPVIEDALLPSEKHSHSKPGPAWEIIRTFHQGVTDNTGETALTAAHAMGFARIRSIRTGKRFVIRGPLTPAQARLAAEKILANPVIETVTVMKTTAHRRSAS